MSSAVWTRKAAHQLESYLDYLAAQSSAAVAEAARADIYAVADQTARMPGLARQAIWPGYRARSVRKWSKLIVFQLAQGRMEVLALYDQRQDLSAVDPLSE